MLFVLSTQQLSALFIYNLLHELTTLLLYVILTGDQRSLYLKCQGLRADLVQDHWEGIKFYNTTFERKVQPDSTLNESTSILHYVDVLYAGKQSYVSL